MVNLEVMINGKRVDIDLTDFTKDDIKTSKVLMTRICSAIGNKSDVKCRFTDVYQCSTNYSDKDKKDIDRIWHYIDKLRDVIPSLEFSLGNSRCAELKMPIDAIAQLSVSTADACKINNFSEFIRSIVTSVVTKDTATINFVGCKFNDVLKYITQIAIDNKVFIDDEQE